MAVSRRHRTKPKLLSHTRPPVHLSSTALGLQLSSKATRSLIRSHHTLQKQLSNATAANDTALASSLQAQIDAQGGLEKYQRASIQGQASDRGGDSSRVLVQWIEDLQGGATTNGSDGQGKLRMLEVGSLRVDNACARSGMFDMERIDLHSQHEDIMEQDFMQRPLPRPGELAEVGYDVVSLSLVVNYVGDAVQRGEMLKRVESFFRRRQINGLRSLKLANHFMPGLFLVLPAPCVLNSRYLNEERLEEIMIALGYGLVKKKLSNKLVYYYWQFAGERLNEKATFGKKELRKGKDRNNFAIILR